LVVDERDGGHHGLAVWPNLSTALADKIADEFRTVGNAAVLHEALQPPGESGFERDADPDEFRHDGVLR
jgi:hypothetical protein